MEEIKLYVSRLEIPVFIVPANKKRDMTEEALRCLPLAIASQYGYHVLIADTFTVNWNGGDKRSDIDVRSETGARGMPFVTFFGGGIFSISTNVIIRTPKGVNTWIQGPTNLPKENVFPHSAIVETDWNVPVMGMTYQILKPNVDIVFKKGEPFCTFFPLPRHIEEGYQIVLESLGNSDEDYDRLYQIETTQNAGGKRNGYYKRGVYINGDKCPIDDHQKRLHKPPVKKA